MRRSSCRVEMNHQEKFVEVSNISNDRLEFLNKANKFMGFGDLGPSTRKRLRFPRRKSKQKRLQLLDLKTAGSELVQVTFPKTTGIVKASPQILRTWKVLCRVHSRSEIITPRACFGLRHTRQRHGDQQQKTSPGAIASSVLQPESERKIRLHFLHRSLHEAHLLPDCGFCSVQMSLNAHLRLPLGGSGPPDWQRRFACCKPHPLDVGPLDSVTTDLDPYTWSPNSKRRVTIAWSNQGWLLRYVQQRVEGWSQNQRKRRKPRRLGPHKTRTFWVLVGSGAVKEIVTRTNTSLVWIWESRSSLRWTRYTCSGGARSDRWRKQSVPPQGCQDGWNRLEGKEQLLRSWVIRASSWLTWISVFT